jgi:RHS repeat-associated protein
MTFLNIDDAPGTILSSADQDLLEPNVEKVTAKTYQPTSLEGVPWMQLQSESRGWSTTNTTPPQQMLEETQYAAYASVCPSQIVKTSSAGTLTTTKTFYSIPAFANALTCLDEHVTMVGTHSDNTLNFRHEAEITRNAVGLVSNVTMFGPATGNGTGTPLDVQDVTYATDWDVQTISNPGKGTSTYAFAPGTDLLASVAAPDGVVTAVTKRDPLTDAILEFAVNRGSLTYVQDFTFDPMERLATSWNNLGSATAAVPDETDTYRYASGTMPALTHVTTLATLSWPQGASSPPAATYAQSAYVAAADGAELALAELIPQGWRFGRATQRSRTTRTQNNFVSPTVPDVTALDVPSLYARAQLVGATQPSLYGFAASKSTTYQANVTRSLTDMLSLDAAGAERTEVENGAFSTTSTLDEEGRVARYVDQAGTSTGYAYDALGRIRRIVLPDGTRHAIDYNDYGQVTRVARDGVATLAYTYDPATGLLKERDTVAAAGTPTAGTIWERAEYQYDGVGRISRETDVDSASGASKTFQYYYDGASPANPGATNALGLLTAVVGDRYTRTMTYRADGAETSRVVSIDGWRTIENDALFDEDGTIRQTTLRISDGSGNLLATDVSTSTRDAYGRLVATQRDGFPFASYAYDANGLPLTATFSGPYANGETATIAYDPATRLRMGLRQSNATWGAAVTQLMNARGLADSQTLAVSTLSTTRRFAYSPQGFLAQSSDSTANYAYSYAPDGQPAQIVSTINGVNDTRTFARTGNVLTAGTHQQTFDDVGRVMQRDDVTLIYGGDGQVAGAQNKASEWSYLYDEKGNRVAKLVGGVPVVAYLPDGSYLDANALTTPQRFASQILAVLTTSTNGSPATKAISLVAVDLIGTVQSDQDGTPRLASPFGDRANHPDIAAAIDYAAQGYDADLGVVRMGVRDYDPTVSRFLSPDPLYLGTPSKCVGNPVDCTLYAYARNNPLLVVDPSGQAGVSIGLTGGAEIGDTFGFFGGGGSSSLSLYIGTEGVKLLFTPAAVLPYGSSSSSWENGFVKGAVTGAGVSVNVVRDGNAQLGDGRERSISTPVASGSFGYTKDGELNSLGVSVGPSLGAAVHETRNYTVELHPLDALGRALSRGGPPPPGNAGFGGAPPASSPASPPAESTQPESAPAESEPAMPEPAATMPEPVATMPEPGPSEALCK